MTRKEKAQIIRTQLKKQGITSKQVSVKSSKCGYSDAIDITIKDLSIDCDMVEKIASKYEKIDYDKYTGEILAGGNDYVTVCYDWEVLHKAAEKEFETTEKIVDELKERTENGSCDICTYDGKRYILCIFENRFSIYEVTENNRITGWIPETGMKWELAKWIAIAKSKRIYR